jgi:putative transposase
MRLKTVAALLVDLEVLKTHRRPYVSNDNPLSESHFKTFKYRPDFPDRFGCIEDARAHAQTFFARYNTEHRHSGIALMTSHTVHYGGAPYLTRTRSATLDAAFLAHPERLRNVAPRPPELPVAAWINPPKKKGPQNRINLMLRSH